MGYFVRNIRVNKIYHLENFDIPVCDASTPHLIITGKNGSGKTILLNAISEFFVEICADQNLSFLRNNENLKMYERQKSSSNNVQDSRLYDSLIESTRNSIERLFGKVEIEFNSIGDVTEKYHRGDFIFAFYQAKRKPEMSEPQNPTKPLLSPVMSVKDRATDQFLNFLSDLKVQEALARNENMLVDADNIKEWFTNFQSLLAQIFDDRELQLRFNYKDYSFTIETGGKAFRFTQLSDGYAAIIEIVADLILRMQSKDSLTRAYEKEGVVIIDEIETHLHLELQRVIMPMLTKVFPNIQFIVSTHSPFVLNSLPNAVAFDLENKKQITQLNEYSYEALAEGYFGVRTESSYMELKLDQLKKLLEQPANSDSEKFLIRESIAEFKKIPDVVSPMIKGEFNSLLIKHFSKVNEFMQ